MAPVTVTFTKVLRCYRHYICFISATQFGSVNLTLGHAKILIKMGLFYGQNAIAKEPERAYTPSPHLPPLTFKVSQAEIEAGDCEGRLPLLF
jgi:hypothetical protein